MVSLRFGGDRQGPAPETGLTIRYPLDGTLFPPEIPPPTFRWRDQTAGVDAWRITIGFQDGGGELHFDSGVRHWAPTAEQWAAIKERSLGKDAAVTIRGVRGGGRSAVPSGARVTIRTSRDEVGAPLFYREVNLPFIEAVRDPSRIRWRFGPVSSPEPPPVVLEKLPVCGNCHSFTASGQTLAMDIDYANSKGSYVITRVAEEMRLATSDIITWNDYRREDGEQTFGLLSQISPDGRFVVSTVKDKSVFVPRDGLEFSQLFFPIRGILAWYDRQQRTFGALPGADDPRYVQSNPAWSPDGRYLVFARTEAYSLKHTRGKGKVLLTREECLEFLRDGKPFLFDLYRIPFHDGKGGRAEPLEGASRNGMSNFFAKYSPDGKWIVFCKARSYMLLQPDSELYILPAAGGEARRLRCNTPRMNSWHSWSPNGRWLVFASKANGPYTQLWLTHIDEEGRSTPPVLLDRLTTADRAVNIPEFVPAGAVAIRKIHEAFLNDNSFVRAGNQHFMAGETDRAIRSYRKALGLNPHNAEAHRRLGFLLYHVKAEHARGMAHLTRALNLAPHDGPANYEMGMALLHQKQIRKAVEHLAEAVRRMPNGLGAQYRPAEMRYHLARGLVFARRPAQAAAHLEQAVQLDPSHAEAHYYLALVLAMQGQIDRPLKHYAEAVKLKPGVDRFPTLHDHLAANYARAGRFGEAARSAERALRLARAGGLGDLARSIEARLERYRQNRP